jgi:hypothetical protein
MADNEFGKVPATHKYIPRIEPRENNLFIEEYFSGTDTRIYIDDEEQTEIGYIAYSLQEQLKPIYGYASNTFDDVAIGSRIVSGTLKIPIKNQEAQTQLEEILFNDISSNTDYNQKEIDNFNKNEWIDPNNSRLDATKETLIGNDTYAYADKLNAIGYKNDSNMNNIQISNAIKQFQEDNSIEVTGELTNETKNKIDEIYNNRNNEKIRIPSGTVIYYGPSEAHGVCVVLSEITQATVIKEYENGWKMIQTKNNVTGYINSTSMEA